MFFQKILTSQKLIDKGASYDFLNTWLGSGLLLASGTHLFIKLNTLLIIIVCKIFD